MSEAGCACAFEDSDAASRSAAFSSAMIGCTTLVATSLRFAKVSGRLLQAGGLKVSGVAAELAAELFGVAAGEAPTPAAAAFAISFLPDQACVDAGGALARAVELFSWSPLPFASPKSARHSSE